MTKFKSIFEEHYPLVFRRALLILGDRVAAEDVAQEAFVRLWRTPPGDFRNVGGWLCTVASHLCYNYLRGERRRRDLEVRIAKDRSDAGGEVEDLAIPNCEAESVRGALARLPDRDRVILVMKFSGHSYSEIASAIGVENSSIGTLLARAQARFRKEYESGGGARREVLQFRGTTGLP